MAVQAEYPSDVLVLPETSCNRMRQLSEEEWNFVRSADFNVDFAIPDLKMLPAAPDGVSSRPLQSFPLEGSMDAMATRWPSYAAMPELSPSPNMWMSRRESDQPLNFLPSEGFKPKATSLNLQLKSCGFTGLRLSVQDDHSNATCRKELNNNNSNILCASNNLAAEIQRQKEEMEQFIRVQEEEMRRSLVERTEKHSKALLCTAAAAVTRKLQEKDFELLHLKRKNVELEEQIRGLVIESQAWQKRAKSSEAMAAALKLQIDQINKEGSGDSEEEAMNTAIANISSSSSCQVIPNNNNNYIYMENLLLEMQRKCRVCRRNEVCILLLPCRHLCLCKQCDSKIDVCPLCSALKTASVQVQIT